jgi:hypothetical protein
MAFIDLRDLTLWPAELNAAFESHQQAVKAYATRDRYALLIGMFINIVMARYLLKRGGMPDDLPSLAGIMLLQACQAALLHWRPNTYARHRTMISLVNRAIRTGTVIRRFWPMAGNPTSCHAYEQALVIIRTHSPARALAMCAPMPACLPACLPACTWICMQRGGWARCKCLLLHSRPPAASPSYPSPWSLQAGHAGALHEPHPRGVHPAAVQSCGAHDPGPLNRGCDAGGAGARVRC